MAGLQSGEGRTVIEYVNVKYTDSHVANALRRAAKTVSWFVTLK